MKTRKKEKFSQRHQVELRQEMARHLSCPINRAAEVWMTERGAIDACLKLSSVSNWTLTGATGNEECNICINKKGLLEGEKFIAPKNLFYFTADRFAELKDKYTRSTTHR